MKILIPKEIGKEAWFSYDEDSNRHPCCSVGIMALQTGYTEDRLPSIHVASKLGIPWQNIKLLQIANDEAESNEARKELLHAFLDLHGVEWEDE